MKKRVTTLTCVCGCIYREEMYRHWCNKTITSQKKILNGVQENRTNHGDRSTKNEHFAANINRQHAMKWLALTGMHFHCLMISQRYSAHQAFGSVNLHFQGGKGERRWVLVLLKCSFWIWQSQPSNMLILFWQSHEWMLQQFIWRGPIIRIYPDALVYETASDWR